MPSAQAKPLHASSLQQDPLRKWPTALRMPKDWSNELKLSWKSSTHGMRNESDPLIFLLCCYPACSSWTRCGGSFIGWTEPIWSARCLGYPRFLSFAEASDLGDRAAGPSLRPRSCHETPDLIPIFGVIVKDPLTIRARLQTSPGVVGNRFHN